MSGESCGRWASEGVFVLFCALLVWAPIPLASNRQWAWSILALAIFALGAMWFLLYAFGRVRFPGTFRRAWWAVGLFAAWLAVVAVQVIPLPVEWVALVSPESVAMHALSWTTEEASRVTISVDPAATWAFLLKSLAFFLAFCLMLALVDRRYRLKALMFTLVGSGLLQAVYASFMHLTGASFEVFHSMYFHREYTVGTFINRNHLAGYLEMTLAVGIGAMIATLRGAGTRTWRQRFRDWTAWVLSPKILLRLMLVVMVIALVMTRSRMGNSAFFVSMLVAGVLGLLLSRHATRQTVVLLVSLIAIDIFVVGAWFGVGKVVQRLESTSIMKSEARGEQSVEERAEPVLYALPFLRTYPWVGSGGGTFYAVFPRYRSQEIVDFFDFVHNDYVQFAAETGLAGLALLGLLVLSTFLIALKTQYERRDPLSRGAAFGATMGIISLMIHSWVDFNLQIPANALTFVVLLAMGWVAYSVERRGGEENG